MEFFVKFYSESEYNSYLCSPKYMIMAQNKFRITQKDFLIANRRASRLEEIEAHGHPVISRTMTHKSKKIYDRKQFKRAAIKSDDSSYCFQSSIKKSS